MPENFSSQGMAENDDDQDSALKTRCLLSSSITTRGQEDEPKKSCLLVPAKLRCRKSRKFLTTAVLTCQGDIQDPQFPRKLNNLVQALQNVLSNGKKRKIEVMKVEPWNSVRVTFNIPKEAAQRLRLLAEQGDRALRDLGILSVQIEGDQVISLTIAGRYNEPQEIILRPEETSTASTSGLLSELAKKAAAASSFDVSNSEPTAGPSNVETTRKNIADYLRQQGVSSAANVGPSTTQSTSSPLLPFKSPNVVAPNNETIPFPPSSNPSAPPISSRPRFPFASMSRAMTTMQQQTTSSTTPFTPPPFYSVKSSLCESKPSFASPNSVFNSVPRGNVALSSPLLVNLLQNDVDSSNLANETNKMLPPPPPPDSHLSPNRRKKRLKKDDPDPIQQNSMQPIIGQSPKSTSLLLTDAEVATQRPPSTSTVSTPLFSVKTVTCNSIPLPESSSHSKILPTNPPETSEKSDFASKLSSKTQHLINPFTGQLEPMEVDDDDDDDFNPVSILDHTPPKVPPQSPEKLKLKLKLDSKPNPERKDPQPYRVDVSFVSIPTVGRSSEPRVPPLHISLKGKSATVVLKDDAGSECPSVSKSAAIQPTTTGYKSDYESLMPSLVDNSQANVGSTTKVIDTNCTLTTTTVISDSSKPAIPTSISPTNKGPSPPIPQQLNQQNVPSPSVLRNKINSVFRSKTEIIPVNKVNCNVVKNRQFLPMPESNSNVITNSHLIVSCDGTAKVSKNTSTVINSVAKSATLFEVHGPEINGEFEPKISPVANMVSVGMVSVKNSPPLVGNHSEGGDSNGVPQLVSSKGLDNGDAVPSEDSSLDKKPSSDDRVGQSIFNVSSDNATGPNDTGAQDDLEESCLSGSASEGESPPHDSPAPNQNLSNGLDSPHKAEAEEAPDKPEIVVELDEPKQEVEEECGVNNRLKVESKLAVKSEETVVKPVVENHNLKLLPSSPIVFKLASDKNSSSGIVLSQLNSISMTKGSLGPSQTPPNSIIMPLNSNAKHVPIKLVTLPTASNSSSQLVELSVGSTNNHIISSPIKTVPLGGASFLGSQSRPMRLVVSKVSAMKANSTSISTNANFVPMATMVVKSVVANSTNKMEVMKSLMPVVDKVNVRNEEHIENHVQSSDDPSPPPLNNCSDEVSNDFSKEVQVEKEDSTAKVPDELPVDVIEESKKNPDDLSDEVKVESESSEKKPDDLPKEVKVEKQSLEKISNDFPKEGSEKVSDDLPNDVNGSAKESDDIPKEVVVVKDESEKVAPKLDPDDVADQESPKAHKEESGHEENLPVLCSDHNYVNSLPEDDVGKDPPPKNEDIVANNKRKLESVDEEDEVDAKKVKLDDPDDLGSVDGDCISLDGEMDLLTNVYNKPIKRKCSDGLVKACIGVEEGPKRAAALAANMAIMHKNLEEKKEPDEKVKTVKINKKEEAVKTSKENGPEEDVAPSESTRSKLSAKTRSSFVSSNDTRSSRSRQQHKDDKTVETNTPTSSSRNRVTREESKSKRLSEKSKGRESSPPRNRSNKLTTIDDVDVSKKRKTRSSSTASHQEHVEPPVTTNKRRRR